MPFEPDAIHGIYEICRSNFRACDRLAYKALEVAHDQDAKRVLPGRVVAARGLLS